MILIAAPILLHVSAVTPRRNTALSISTAMRNPYCMADMFGRGTVPDGQSVCIGGTATLSKPSMTLSMVPPSAPPQRFEHTSSCQWTKPMRILLVHVGKTAGTSVFDALATAPVNFTVVHASLPRDAMDRMMEDYDLYIFMTREPISRTISAFNWLHFDGGGNFDSADMNWTDWTSRSAGFREVEDTFRDNWTKAPLWLDRNESILGALSHCFAMLPGGVNAFAESLDSEGACADIARRALQEPASGSGHLAKGYAWHLSMSATPSGVNGYAQTLLDLMRLPGKHVFHVAQENLDDDVAAMWRWLCVADPPALLDEVANPLVTPRAIERHADTALSEAGRAALEAHLKAEYYYLNAVNWLTENSLSSAIDGAPLWRAKRSLQSGRK